MKFTLHPVGGTDTKNLESVAQYLANRSCQCQPRQPAAIILDQETRGVVVTVKRTGEVLEVKRQKVRRKFARGAFDLFGIILQFLQNLQLLLLNERRQVGVD